MRSYKFRVVAVYAPNCVQERRSFVRWFGSYLSGLEPLILVEDWNAISDPK